MQLYKPALKHSKDYDYLIKMATNIRHSVMTKREPIIWQTNQTPPIFLAAINQKDLRLWVQTSLELPHITLDSLKNNRYRSNLLTRKLPEQKIKLEGDFQKYFQLKTEKKQQIVALQVMSPEIMADLIDYSAHYDIEIYDNDVAMLARDALKNEESIRFAILQTEKLAHIVKNIHKMTKVT